MIRVGGATEVEVKERKDRVDDAMHATRAAVEEGILPGGGVALLRSIKALGRLKAENDDQKTGIDIVRKRSAHRPAKLLSMLARTAQLSLARSATMRPIPTVTMRRRGQYGDLVSKGIIDPTKVVRTALQDAASIAGLLMTTEAMVAGNPEGDAGRCLACRLAGVWITKSLRKARRPGPCFGPSFIPSCSRLTYHGYYH